MKKYYYQHLVCGGTFDHLHTGHKHFLRTALNLAEKVDIGLTDFPAYQKPWALAIQNYKQRKQALNRYFAQNNFANRVNIVPLYDSFGPSTLRPEYDSILITENTLEGAKKVNYFRQKKGLKSLNIIKSELVPGFSSTRTRQGRLITQGQTLCNNYYLPEDNRRHFQKPLGQMIWSPRSFTWSAYMAKKIIASFMPSTVTAVGDIAAYSLVTEGIKLDLAIVDQKSRRQPVDTAVHRRLYQEADQVLQLTNPAGTLSAELVSSSQNIFHKPGQKLIQVRGEEDLAVLPLILFAPLNSLIFYGQPHQGLVAVRVTPAKKQHCLNLLKYFI